MNNTISFNTPIDDETKEHIANALWMPTFEPEKIEDDVVVKLQDTKNSAQSFGTRMNTYLDWLLAHPQSHNPSYKLRYSTPVSYTHLRAHETGRNLVCRLLLEKK